MIQIGFSIPLQPLTNFEIQKFYQNEPRFNEVYSRDNLPKIRVEFKGSCSKQDKISFNYGKIVSIYIAYEISKIFNISIYPILENCLFDALELTKHPDIDQCKYSGYGIEFDRKGFFSLGN